MRTQDIPNCPFLLDIGCTYEEDGFIQFDPIKGIKMMYVYPDGEEVLVDAFQRTGGEYGDATGWVITHSDSRYCSEVLDDEEFTLHIYQKPLVL